MSKNRTGNFIAGGNPKVPSLSYNNGVFDQKDVYTATNNKSWQEVDGIYEIPRSLRCRYITTGSLIKNSNLPTPTNSSKWTVSMWVKRGDLGAISNHYNSLFGKTISAAANFAMYFGYSGSTDRDNITWTFDNSYSLQTSQLFRDVAGWYHFVFVWDSANPTATERAKIYVNGTQIMQFSTDYRSQISTAKDCWNTTNTSFTGAIAATSANASVPNSSLDGYITEFINVDGQCLDPSYFGYFDPNTNIWQPKQYTGTYGNAGGYFNFSENQSTYNLGRNFAGTNYITYSSVFNNGAWVNDNLTLTANSTVAPDGTTTAFTFAETTVNGIHRVYWQGGGSGYNIQNGVYATGSVYVKKNTARYAWVSISYSGGRGPQALVDLDTGLIVAANSSQGAGIIKGSSSTHVGNGWYRISVTSQATTDGYHYLNVGLSNTTSLVGDYPSYTGSASNSVYVWGAQLNLGSTVDPYIPTTSSSANNDWAPYGLSLTNDATYDSMVDSPTNVMTNATDIGGVVSGNYATTSSLDTRTYSPGFKDGSLGLIGYTDNRHTRSTIGVSSGKWYWEIKCDSASPNFHHGVSAGQQAVSSGLDFLGNYSNEWGYWPNTGGVNTGYWRNNGVGPVYGDLPRAAQNDILMFALDVDNGKIYAGLNGTWFKSGNPVAGTGALSTNIPTNGTPIFPHFMQYDAAGVSINFGQRPFAYTPPSGFKSINTTNLQALGTAITSKAALQANKWFDATIYSGSGTTNTITNSGGFSPDLLWAKSRSYGTRNVLWDTVRGTTSRLSTNDTATETSSYDGFTGFTSNGFTADGSGSGGDVNAAGRSYVAWQWKQSPTPGFNIVPYTGTGTNMTISHNLGVPPKLIIIKERTSVSNWVIQHDSLGWASGFLGFNTSVATTTTNFSNNTAPTSSNFTVSGYSNGDGTGTRNYIAYLWAEVPGFSKFGSFTGNGSADGPFIYTGFRPKWIMIKNYNAGAYSAGWTIIDTSRSTSNITVHAVQADTASAEFTYATIADITSNGFKIRTAWDSVNNATPLIYAAFAESPFALNNRAR